MASLSHCTWSNSVSLPGPPVAGRSLRPISRQPSASSASMARWATVWLATCSALSTASNWLTISAELTISLPSPRRNSTVPASTIETYMMSLLGEYCIATVCAPESVAGDDVLSQVVAGHPTFAVFEKPLDPRILIDFLKGSSASRTGGGLETPPAHEPAHPLFHHARRSLSLHNDSCLSRVGSCSAIR